MRFPALLPAAAAAAALAAFAPPASAGYGQYAAGDRACPGATDGGAAPAVQEQSMRCLINWARARRGARRLSPSSQLAKAARIKTGWISACNQFSHTPCAHPFASAFAQSGYAAGRSWSAGENIAFLAPSAHAAPRTVLLMWLNSPGHRRNLFDGRWREQGVDLRQDRSWMGFSDVALWSSEFGARG